MEAQEVIAEAERPMRAVRRPGLGVDIVGVGWGVLGGFLGIGVMEAGMGLSY